MFTAQANLESILVAMKFDGDIDFRPTSRNVAKLISEECDLELWYISLEIPTSNVEAFVVADKKGNFTFFDDMTNTLVINNQIVRENCRTEPVEDVLEEYMIDGASFDRPPKPGHIAAYVKVLEQMGR